MTALYLTLLIFGLTIFVLAIFGNVDHDFGHHIDFGGHDFHFDMFGHHFDFGGHGVDSHMEDQPGLFSIRTISALFAGFGVSGLLAKWVLNWGIWGQLGLGIFTGLAMAGLAYLIMYAMYTQQAGTVKDSSRLVGKTVVVTTPTGDQGIGECRVENLHYTFREKNGIKLQANQVAKVVEAEVGLLVVEKL